MNQASITGEATPVTKTAGDEVFAGTIGDEGSRLLVTLSGLRLAASSPNVIGQWWLDAHHVEYPD